MACIRTVGGCPMTVRELNEIVGEAHGVVPGPAFIDHAGYRHDAVTEETIIEPEGTAFICGPIADGAALCRCQHLSDLLCDWPMGKGRTCDLPLCRCCAKEIGEDMHLCAIHWPMWVKQTGTGETGVSVHEKLTIGYSCGPDRRRDGHERSNEVSSTKVRSHRQRTQGGQS